MYHCLNSHHFDDVKAVTITLSSVLKPGGVLIVADFLATEKPFVGEDSEKHAKEHGVHHAHGTYINVFMRSCNSTERDVLSH